MQRLALFDLDGTLADSERAFVVWAQQAGSRYAADHPAEHPAEAETGEGLLLQIFTENMVGPIFFEIIQRKGNEGFGNGNFQALFESIELDQIRRGVIKVDA